MKEKCTRCGRETEYEVSMLFTPILIAKLKVIFQIHNGMTE